jgi:hypothetical protein
MWCDPCVFFSVGTPDPSGEKSWIEIARWAREGPPCPVCCVSAACLLLAVSLLPAVHRLLFSIHTLLLDFHLLLAAACLLLLSKVCCFLSAAYCLLAFAVCCLSAVAVCCLLSAGATHELGRRGGGGGGGMIRNLSIRTFIYPTLDLSFSSPFARSASLPP